VSESLIIWSDDILKTIRSDSISVDIDSETEQGRSG
jgi:hypothetical protein